MLYFLFLTQKVACYNTTYTLLLLAFSLNNVTWKRCLISLQKTSTALCTSASILGSAPQFQPPQLPWPLSSQLNKMAPLCLGSTIRRNGSQSTSCDHGAHLIRFPL